MTIVERIKSLMSPDVDIDMGDGNAPASVDKMIALAYMMGEEAATKRVSDAYTNLIREMQYRADECRYSKMANSVIGTRNYIYFSEYAQDMTHIFGQDKSDK